MKLKRPESTMKPDQESAGRRYPIGAEFTPAGVSFRVWAPEQKSLGIRLRSDREIVPLLQEEGGYFSAVVPGLKPGTRYILHLDTGEEIADPASRFQPEGPHGPSQLIDPSLFKWTDRNWTGLDLEEAVIYEIHIGTFSKEGTWAGAIRELPELAAIGVNCLEIMPIADFPGRWGWGYDGVSLFAPLHHYGTPDEFRAFVDRAHRLGICILLDVVYNHFGPDGNHLKKLAKDYFSKEHITDWGEAINFDGEHSGPVREFFLTNAAYWISEFHLDGLRLDATQDIHDAAPPQHHILTEIGQTTRAAAPDRKIVVISENEPQWSELCRSTDQGGFGLDGLWNDDFHHSAMVTLTGKREAYYTDYSGDPQEFISAAKYGYLYQGQWYSWQKAGRGRPGFDLAPSNFITFIQNHDQIANSGSGRRAHLLGSPGRYRALTALLLLGPGTPMLFQGQEFAASAPFLYFADHNPELAKMVAAGRLKFLNQFPSLNDPEMQQHSREPAHPDTFRLCKLDFTERESHATYYRLTKELLRIRNSDPSFRSATRRALDGAVLGPHAFVLRYFLRNASDRLLLINFGPELRLPTIPEPLVGSPPHQKWKTQLSTEQYEFGGGGVAPVITDSDGWRIPAECAVFMALTTSPLQPVQEKKQ